MCAPTLPSRSVLLNARPALVFSVRAVATTSSAPSPSAPRQTDVPTKGAPGMTRLPNTTHTSRPWRIHEFTGDFELEDVWELPTPGGPDELVRLVQLVATQDADDRDYPAAFRALFALRWKLGALFGWDKADSGVGERVRSLRERLPADLLEGPRGPDLRAVPGRTEMDGPPVFSSVYQTHDEWVAELSNKTVHSLMHIGWVPDDSGGGYHALMAVLTKPNGWLGKAYMAAIKPFRCALIYPMLLRSIERQWQAPERVRRVSVTDRSPPVAASAVEGARGRGVADENPHRPCRRARRSYSSPTRSPSPTMAP